MFKIALLGTFEDEWNVEQASDYLKNELQEKRRHEDDVLQPVISAYGEEEWIRGNGYRVVPSLFSRNAETIIHTSVTPPSPNMHESEVIVDTPVIRIKVRKDKLIFRILADEYSEKLEPIVGKLLRDGLAKGKLGTIKTIAEAGHRV